MLELDGGKLEEVGSKECCKYFSLWDCVLKVRVALFAPPSFEYQPSRSFYTDSRSFY
jgi:hypothetical protein